MLDETGFLEEERRKREQLEAQWEQQLVDQLPDLEGDTLVFEWKLNLFPTQTAHEKEWMLLHNGQVVYRQQAYWEDYRHYLRMLRALKGKYGQRVKDFIPSDDPGSFGNMYGDDLSGPGVVAQARKQLRESSAD